MLRRQALVYALVIAGALVLGGTGFAASRHANPTVVRTHAAKAVKQHAAPKAKPDRQAHHASPGLAVSLPASTSSAGGSESSGEDESSLEDQCSSGSTEEGSDESDESVSSDEGSQSECSDEGSSTDEEHADGEHSGGEDSGEDSGDGD